MIKAKFRHCYLPTVLRPSGDILGVYSSIFPKRDYKYLKSNIKEWRDCTHTIDFLTLQSPLVYIIFGFENGN